MFDALPTLVMTLGGAIAPFLVNFIVKGIKEAWARFLLAIGLSGGIALVSMLILQVPMALADVAVWLPQFILLGQIAWRLWWHKLLK